MSVLIGAIPQHKSFIGFVPPVGSISPPWRRVVPDILRRVLAAIRHNKALEIDYLTMTESGRLRRWISPHALGVDNFRWHCRAYCHIDNAFKDFTLGRILHVVGEKESEANPYDDKDWNTYILVQIGPNPILDERKQKIIEFEYGMENGQISLQVRRSMLLYFLNMLGLQIDINEDTVRKQYITILNKDEVKRGLGNL